MRLVATGAAVAVAALVGLIASVAGYASTFPVAPTALIAAYVAVAILAATVGAGRELPPWSVMAALSLALALGAFALWPRPPVLINYLAPALALASATLAGIAAVAWGSQRWRRSRPTLPSSPNWRVPLISTAAVALAVAGLLTLAAFNPFGLGFLMSAVLIGITAVRAIVRSPRRVVAAILALGTAPVPILTAVGILIATNEVADRRYEVPAAYRGWVAIELENPGCPGSQRSGTELVFRVDARGCGCTSSSEPRGFGRWRFMAVSPGGSLTELPNRGGQPEDLIWGSHAGTDSTRTYPYDAFFVGSQSEFMASSAAQTRRQVERCLLAR